MCRETESLAEGKGGWRAPTLVSLPSSSLSTVGGRRPCESESGLPSFGVHVTARSFAVVSVVALEREEGGVLGSRGRGKGGRRRREREEGG